MNWHCITHGVQRGPMTLDAMRSLVASGALLPRDYVWEPGFGAEWREAGSVAELFPARAEEAQQRALPLEGVEHAPRVSAALAHARNRMVVLLFKPFSAGVWLRFLLFVVMARMNPLSELAARFLQAAREPGGAAPAPGPQLARAMARRLASDWDAFAAMPVSGRLSNGAAALLVLALILVVTLHVSGWGVFALLHGWHNPRARLGEALANSRAFSKALIRWKFVYTAPLLAVFLGGFFVFFHAAVLPFARHGMAADFAGGRIFAASLAWGGAWMLLAFMNVLTDQFAAPLMYWRGVGVRGAFALLWQCVSGHPLAFARFALAYGALVALAALVFATALPQGQPGGASVLAAALFFAGFMPFHILMRGMGLFFLAQWRLERMRAEKPAE